MNTFTLHNYKEEPIRYDGTQLAPHWIYRRFAILGDAIVAFSGPADVPIQHMVDLEDVGKNAPIYSPRMLHFLGEWFVDSLDSGVLLQHLFVCEIYERLMERGVSGLRRTGNDIYFENRKLSVSIATRSLVSVLFHIGLNIETEGTPVPTVGLSEWKIDPFEFADEILERFAVDSAIWRRSRVKVLSR